MKEVYAIGMMTLVLLALIVFSEPPEQEDVLYVISGTTSDEWKTHKVWSMDISKGQAIQWEYLSPYLTISGCDNSNRPEYSGGTGDCHVTLQTEMANYTWAAYYRIVEVEY